MSFYSHLASPLWRTPVNLNVRHQKVRPMIFGMFGRKKTASTAGDSDWPLQGPRNEAALTVEAIINGELPILRVVHDASDGGWQFLTGNQVEEHQAKLVSLGSITKLDPTVLELADLPEGWYAERKSVASAWQRSQVE